QTGHVGDNSRTNRTEPVPWLKSVFNSATPCRSSRIGAAVATGYARGCDAAKAAITTTTASGPRRRRRVFLRSLTTVASQHPINPPVGPPRRGQQEHDDHRHDPHGDATVTER